jgi:hypothetical protein
MGKIYKKRNAVKEKKTAEGNGMTSFLREN